MQFHLTDAGIHLYDDTHDCDPGCHAPGESWVGNHLATDWLTSPGKPGHLTDMASF